MSAERERAIVSRRVYHVSMGVLEASLYAVPISFLVPYLLGDGSAVALIVSVVLWVVVWAWVMRRSVARFGETRDAPVAGTGEAAQVTVLRYTAVASAILLIFVAAPVVLLTLAPTAPAGALLEPSGVAFFLCVILLALCTAFCLVGLSPRVRRSLYPEYPGITATFLFALAMVALFASALTGFSA